MEYVVMLGTGLAFLVMVISAIATIVVAFRQSILWGLAYLFLPFANIVFVIRYWAEAKTSFLISVVSGIGAVVGLMAMPSGQFEGFASNPADRVSEITAQIQEKRDRIYQIETAFAQGTPAVAKQFEELEARRKVLDASDTAALTQFNAEAAAYQQQNESRRLMLQEIEAEKKSLSSLLAERSTLARTTPGGGSSGGSQRIVMYSAAWCPACKAAKQYMAQRGIPFDERDVDKSPSDRAEFQRLGGRGVPLILVGDKRMEGFNPKAFEAML